MAAGTVGAHFYKMKQWRRHSRASPTLALYSITYPGMATMQLRIAILATLLAVAYGCATEPEQQAGAAAPAQPQPSRGYITGSRLPLPDDAGSSTVSGL